MLWYASRVLSDHNSLPRVFYCLCDLPFRHTGSSHVSWRHLHSCKYDWPLEWEGMPALLTWSLLQVMIHFNLAFFHFVLSSLASLFCADKSMLSSSQLFYHNSVIQGKKYNLRYSFWLQRCWICEFWEASQSSLTSLSRYKEASEGDSG